MPIRASGVSDGHLQLLGLLTGLFGDMQDRASLLLFDEPETSLHPHALAVFAEAVCEAAKRWNRQVFLATHSPVLISQFEPSHVVVAEGRPGPLHGTATRLRDQGIAGRNSTVFGRHTLHGRGSGTTECPAILTFRCELSKMAHEICRFGLVVTGKGEEEFLPRLFRVLMAKAHCLFTVIRRVGQRSPVTAPARLLRMVGKGQRIPTKDEQEIGLPVLLFLRRHPGSYAMIVDDLEGAPVRSRPKSSPGIGPR